MSITSDIRAYADTAVNQGKQVLDTAQAQLNDVTGQANELVAATPPPRVTTSPTSPARPAAPSTTCAPRPRRPSTSTPSRPAVEPYLAQVKELHQPPSPTGRGRSSSGVLNDKRVALVVDTVQQRVVKPVQDLTGRGVKPVDQARHQVGSEADQGRGQAGQQAGRDPPATRRRPSRPASRPRARPRPSAPPRADRAQSCVARARGCDPATHALPRPDFGTGQLSRLGVGTLTGVNVVDRPLPTGRTTSCSTRSSRCGCGRCSTALTRKPAAFPAVDKLTKPAWLAILLISGLLGYASPARRPVPISLISVVVAAVYLADVRPAVREISGGR